MAILVIRRVDHTHANGATAVGRLRRGEVVAVVEDGHQFSPAERANAAWEFVALPGVPAANLALLTSRYTDSEMAALQGGLWDGKLAVDRRRAHRLNMTALAALLADAEAAAAFVASPSWDAATAAGLILRYDEGED